MNQITKGLEPARVLSYFEEISAIPRSSGNEKAISEYLLAFAQSHGLESHTDQAHNVVIKKPGSAGYEGLSPVILQGHQDMVCEKRAGVEHDFDQEGIRLKLQDGKLCAEGTTLGADNGIAVAMMLALLEDSSLKAPPLECVFTVQEETGLFGAKTLDGSLLQGRTMINLDSEEEGIATVSCAGGARVLLSRKAEWAPAGKAALSLEISGLLGGHSGMDIALGRGNANKLLGRLLRCGVLENGGRIASLHGGSKDNAIPREAGCVLTFEDEKAMQAAKAQLESLREILKEEILEAEPGFQLQISPVPAPQQALSDTLSVSFAKILSLAPNGVRCRNHAAGDFVISSLNLGVLKLDEETVSLKFAPRSSVASLKEETIFELKLLGESFGFSHSCDGEYPGWSYAPVSPIRDIFCESYFALTGKELRVEAIHAGLECGLFLDKLPGLDAIAVGPAMTGVHTPDEALDIASCERTYLLLRDVLGRLADKG